MSPSKAEHGAPQRPGPQAGRFRRAEEEEGDLILEMAMNGGALDCAPGTKTNIQLERRSVQTPSSGPRAPRGQHPQKTWAYLDVTRRVKEMAREQAGEHPDIVD